MHKSREVTSRPAGTCDHMLICMLIAGVLPGWLCPGASLAGVGPRPSLVLPPAANGAAARPAPQQKSPRAAVSSESQPAGNLARELWSSRVTAPDPNEDAATRLALKRLIRQVKSVRFGNEAAPPAPATPVEARAASAPPKAEPAGVPPARPPAATPAVPTTAAGAPSPSPQAQKTLENLLPASERTKDPLEIAELLFLSGRPAEAAPFYAQALVRLRPGEPATAADRAWALFQLANCLRETNLAEAQATYTKLISEYPDSPWTELARAQSQLVGWYQKDQPQQLVASRRP